MYYPIPGHTHLKVLAPPIEAAQPEPVPQDRSSTLAPLVRLALEAAFGVRDLKILQQRSFSLGVRAHVTARRRGAPPTGGVRVVSCHQRDTHSGTELYGSLVSSGRRYAWVALLRGGRLEAFRVL